MPKIAGGILDRVTRRGTRLNRRGFTLYYLKVLQTPTPRIVISQKIDKRAVVRNRLRRQIKAILAQAKLVHLAIVIIVRKELTILPYNELKIELQKAISQIK